MKFININVHNLNEMVPRWALDPLLLARQLDWMFSSDEGKELVPKGDRLNSNLKFWIEVDAMSDQYQVRVCTADDKIDLSGHLIITCPSTSHAHVQIDLPLNPIFKGYSNIAGMYSVYLHSFQTSTPIGYIGITKQRWFERYSQHLSSAKSGSHLLFHKALRTHVDVVVRHRVMICGVSHDAALELEEEWVGMFALYPLGLNMIPGGLAGFKYLASIGFNAKNAEERDNLLTKVVEADMLNGKPNPLCAARWASDEHYIERVICGHSGRLTAEQVRQIRLAADFGYSPNEIMQQVAARNLRQVKRVLTKDTYFRIKE